MIFSELYNVYYNAVARILSKAADGTLTKESLNNAVENETFRESFLTIIPALKEQKWQLLNSDYSTPLLNRPTMPLTELQRRWLKAISLDPRIKLFDVDFSEFDDVEPLFTQDDYEVFDKYCDGDNFEDEKYIQNFKLITDSIRNDYPLDITIENRHGEEVTMKVIADCIEYSEKDDKFRIITKEPEHSVINLGRIISCEKASEIPFTESSPKKVYSKKLVFELTDERNTLERTMLHFAHFEKETERIDENKYRVTLYYDSNDEAEMVIRILSFGPRIKVTEPESFVNLIKEKLQKQKNYN